MVLATANVVMETNPGLASHTDVFFTVPSHVLKERAKEGDTPPPAPPGFARASDAACSSVDTTAPSLWLDEGTLGQILPRFQHHRTNCQLPSLGHTQTPTGPAELSTAVAMLL